MLTWTIGSDVEPDAASWAAMLPPEPVIPVDPPNKPGPKSKTCPPVLAALAEGVADLESLVTRTGLERKKVRVALYTLASAGRVAALSRGPGARWRLA